MSSVVQTMHLWTLAVMEKNSHETRGKAVSNESLRIWSLII